MGRRDLIATDETFWLVASHNPKITEASHVPTLPGRKNFRLSGSVLILTLQLYYLSLLIFMPL